MDKFIEYYVKGLLFAVKFFIVVSGFVLLSICAISSTMMFVYQFPESPIQSIIIFLWEFLSTLGFVLQVVFWFSLIILIIYLVRKLFLRESKKFKDSRIKQQTKEVKTQNGKTNIR